MKYIPKSDTRYLRNKGKVTLEFRNTLEKVLDQYVGVAEFLSGKLERPREDYSIREAHVVGSILNGNDHSDLDLLLIANKITQFDYRFIKQIMSELFFNNLQKSSAVDVFIRPYDEFPEKNLLK